MRKKYTQPATETTAIAACTILNGSPETPNAVVDCDSESVESGEIEARRKFFD